MEALVYKHQKELRRGYTTGSCAAAAAQAAAIFLLSGQVPASVLLHTPKGIDLHLTPECSHREGQTAVCAIRKDSGDDPGCNERHTDFCRGFQIAAGGAD